jgi:hypothetical protein
MKMEADKVKAMKGMSMPLCLYKRLNWRNAG